MLKSILSILIICLLTYTGSAFADINSDVENTSQKSENLEDSIIILADNPILIALDKMIHSKYQEQLTFNNDSLKISALGFKPDSIPTYSDSVYISRLEQLNNQTPFELAYNSKVKSFINLYAVRKKHLTAKFLGLSNQYFPMFEATLDKYDLPLEFKYLAIVESALQPVARSRAGAVGLWQFIYSTGKMYKLDINSYIDERRDPIKATDAACRYFIDLYKMYENWELVLAAYNCGPGNVNRAIRRAGGKKDYWSLWPFLPNETRGYVPAFIAVNYVMNYSAEHNIHPIQPKYMSTDYDTVMVNRELTFANLSEVLDISTAELEYLNPNYKLQIIPNCKTAQILYLPIDKIGLFVTNEVGIYALQAKITAENPIPTEPVQVKDIRRTHVVRNGEYLGLIASKYNCSVRDIRDWNNLRSSRINIGQRLIVYVPDQEKAPVKKINTENLKGDFYTIQKGDTLWDIANAKGISVTKLKSLNTDLNYKNLKPGTKIRIDSAS